MLDTKGKSDVSTSFFSLQLNESMKEPLGTYCAERRKNLNLTQAQVAETLGYTVQAISKFENGHTEMSLSSLTMLAKLFLCRLMISYTNGKTLQNPLQMEFSSPIASPITSRI